MVRWYGCVQYSKLLNDLGLGIRQQGSSNVLPLREIRQDLYRIIEDRDNPQPLLLELLDVLLQLDELRFAVRSPVRGPVEDHYGSLGTANGVKVLHSSVLIRSAEERNLFADGRPGGGWLGVHPWFRAEASSFPPGQACDCLEVEES